MKRDPGRALAGAAATAALALAGYTKRLRAVQDEQRRRLLEAERRLEDVIADRTRSDRTGQLLQITDAALAALPLEELFHEVLHRACEGLPADAAALLLNDGPLSAAVLRATYGFEPSGEGATLLPGIGLAARVTDGRRAVALIEAEVAAVRLTALRDMGAVAGAPLLLDGQVIGVLEVGRRQAVPFDEADLRLLQLAADRTAIAVDHARVFERERHIAQTLQRSLLPAQMPRIPGVELEARFLPAGRGQEVGGDFYDVIGLGDGRWMLVVGDVCGKGPEAAALTAMVRYTLRAEAAHEPRPGELLGLLNDAMLSQRSDYLFCTAVCALLELSTGRGTLTMAGGGHPMPLLIRRDGHVEPPSEPGGPLIGVWHEAEFAEERFVLAAGDSLIIYTDGLLEAHAPERILPPGALAGLAAGLARQPLPRLVRALESAALGSSIEPVRDDIAILACSLPGERQPGVGPYRRSKLKSDMRRTRVAPDLPGGLRSPDFSSRRETSPPLQLLEPTASS